MSHSAAAQDRPVQPPRPLAIAWRRAALLLCAGAFAAGAAAARCVDEESLDTWVRSAGEPPRAAPDPRGTLLEMVRTAVERSHAVGAARLLAEAAAADVDEARAAKGLQASLNAGAGPAVTSAPGLTQTTAMQLRAGVTLSQLLYDGGRTDRLVDWRAQLAESARLGLLTQTEQLALSTVALALERSRLRQQVQVWGQYQRKMGCLVEALETIVRADRGRASELVQARKSQQQAELAQRDAQSQVRQVEIRLRRLVGDGLPPTDGLATVLMQVPPLEQLVADVDGSAEVAQLSAQEAAARQYARAVEAGGQPQVSWSFTGGGSNGLGHDTSGSDTRARSQRSTSLALGVAVNIPLLAPGVAPASEAARKRAEAVAQQRLEVLQTRRFRVTEVFEQTQNSLDRARRVGAVLRDSDQVRNFTLQQWQQLGRRSLFDVMAAEAEHYSLRVNYINALHEGQQLNANLLSLGRGLAAWLQ